MESCLCNTFKGWKFLFNVSRKYKARGIVAAHGERFHVLGTLYRHMEYAFPFGKSCLFLQVTNRMSIHFFCELQSHHFYARMAKYTTY